MRENIINLAFQVFAKSFLSVRTNVAFSSCGRSPLLKANNGSFIKVLNIARSVFIKLSRNPV